MVCAGRPSAAAMELQGSMEDKDEALQAWRLRCLQAEAEVRALKRSTKPSTVATAARGRGNLPPSADGQHALCEERGMQHEEVVVERLREEIRRLQVAKESIAYEPDVDARLGMTGGCEADRSVELLRQQLQLQNSDMMQLQEDTTREKKQLERQRKSAEAKQSIYHEELREMTQRAESLSEQVRKSKTKTSELHSAREEAAKLRIELDECKAHVDNASIVPVADGDLMYDLKCLRERAESDCEEAPELHRLALEPVQHPLRSLDDHKAASLRPCLQALDPLQEQLKTDPRPRQRCSGWSRSWSRRSEVATSRAADVRTRSVLAQASAPRASIRLHIRMGRRRKSLWHRMGSPICCNRS